jgi:DNA-binding CsgD family transcriptional regulator
MSEYLPIDTFDSPNVASESELLEYVRSHARRLGFDNFVYGYQSGAASPGESRRVFSGYPDSWRHRYDEAGYAEIDPVVQHCLRSTTPVVWTEALFAGPATALREEARGHGLIYGISCPVRDWTGSVGMLSLARDKQFERNETPLPQLMGLAQLLAGFIHAGVNSLIGNQAQQETPVNLTSRERESLQWTGRGKTAWEISKILGISERTAVFHLTNAVQKLGATNRVQAIAIALSRGLI